MTVRRVVTGYFGGQIENRVGRRYATSQGFQAYSGTVCGIDLVDAWHSHPAQRRRRCGHRKKHICATKTRRDAFDDCDFRT